MATKEEIVRLIMEDVYENTIHWHDFMIDLMESYLANKSREELIEEFPQILEGEGNVER